MLKILTPFHILKLTGKGLCVLQIFLAPGNSSNLSFRPGADAGQLIYAEHWLLPSALLSIRADDTPRVTRGRL